jgi:hypothetical protein
VRRTVTFLDGHLAGTRLDTDALVIETIDADGTVDYRLVTYHVDPRTNTATVHRPTSPRTRWMRLRDRLLRWR